jgi:Uma2 family endonuclease
MKAIGPNPTPVRGAHVWPLSVAAYRALSEASLIPENTELLYGFIYQKMPKSPYHCFLLARLLKLLQAILPKHLLLRSEQPVACEDSEPEPDICVVHGSEEDFRHEHPKTAEFVVEICISTHEYDRSKLRAYADAGVKEVWLILGPEKQVEVHTQPQDGRFARQSTHGPGGRLSCGSVPAFTLELDSLFS